MNILFYIPNIDKSFGGVFQYSLALLSIMSKSEHQYFLYKTENTDIKALIVNHKNLHILSSNDYIEPLSIRIARKSINNINSILRKFRVKYKIKFTYQNIHIDYIIKKFKIDIIHCPFQSLQESSWGIPTITTMHDVQELHFPEFFTSKERASRAVRYKNAIDNADAVIVSYQHIKNDLIKYFAKEEYKIHVCLLDMQNLWFEKFSSYDILELKEYNLPEKFILYPAASWEHKNHLKLIEAINILKEEKNIVVNLICTGHITEFYTIIEKQIEKYNLEKQVKFIGTVSDQVLFSLYHKTAAVVIPTLYEAGSFPLMESVIMGIPVICSNVTSLPETIGDNSFIFNPMDPNEIAEKIYRILTNEDYKNYNIKNIEKLAHRIRKNDTINIMNSIYKALTGTN